MIEYGTRACLVCGKEFEVAYPSQLTCSLECRKKRNNQRHQRYRQKQKERLLNLEAVIKEKDAVIASLQAELKILKAQVKKIESKTFKSSQVENFKAAHKLETCERMKLSALNLPCGLRNECWEPSKCDKNKHSARPEKIYKAIIRRQPYAESFDELS